MLPNPMQTPPIGGMAPMNTTPPMNMMPPMPPMGKMPPMEMNLDPMARQNFNNLMSGIQSQSMIPPMPMRMNKGGSVNPLMALIQGIGRLLGFGGGQEQRSSGTLDDFNRAFAAARRAGKKTFSFDRNGDGIPELYTTRLEGEAESANEQGYESELDRSKARFFKEQGMDPRLDMNMSGSMPEAQQASTTMGNEFDVQRKASEPRGMDPRLEMIMNSLSQMQPQVRQGDEFQMAAAADAPSSSVNKATLSAAPDVDTLNTMLSSGVEPIEAQLNALINMSPGSVRETTTKPDVLTKSIAPLSFKEQLRSLLQGLNNMGLSNQLSSSINDKLDELSGLSSSRSRRDVREALGMTEGGNPMVEKLKSIILQSSNPQEKLQEMFTTFKEAEANDEDVSQLLEAVGIIQQSPEFMKDATRSSLIGTMPLQIKERVSDNTKNVEEEFDDVPVLMKEVIEMAIRNAQKGIGMREGGSVTDAIARLENGGDAESESFKQRLEKFLGTNFTDEDKLFGGTLATTAAAYPLAKSLVSDKGRLNRMLLNKDFNFRGQNLDNKAFQKYLKEIGYKPGQGYVKPKISFGEFYKNLPDSEKTLDKKKILMNMLKRGLGTFLKGSGIVAGFSPNRIAQQERFVDGKDMLFKNQGGVVPIQGFTNGGSPTENVKPFFDKDNIFENVLDKFNQTFGPADTGTGGGQYASAKDQAAAENKGKSFFGATSYSYPIGDNILRLSTSTSTGNPFGDDSNPSYSADRYSQKAKGTIGGPKPDIANMTQEEAQAYITTMAPSTKGTTGDYSDLDTFKSYTFYDPNFQFEDFKQAAEIAGYGKKNKLASDTNIASGAAEGTYRQEGEDVVDDDDVVDDTNLGTDTTNTGTTMTSTATTPISPFAQIEQATVVPSTRTVDASFNPSFTPLASTDIYNPNFLTDMPDFSALSIDPSQSAAVDLQKFLDIDEDKTAPKAFTPDTTNITDIMKASGYQQGGAVSPGLNMAIDKFISAYS